MVYVLDVLLRTLVCFCKTLWGTHYCRYHSQYTDHSDVLDRDTQDFTSARRSPAGAPHVNGAREGGRRLRGIANGLCGRLYGIPAVILRLVAQWRGG